MVVGWNIAILTAIGIFGYTNNNGLAWFSIAGVGYLILDMAGL